MCRFRSELWLAFQLRNLEPAQVLVVAGALRLVLYAAASAAGHRLRLDISSADFSPVWTATATEATHPWFAQPLRLRVD